MATHSTILDMNLTDRGASWATVQGVAKSPTQLSDYQQIYKVDSQWEAAV